MIYYILGIVVGWFVVSFPLSILFGRWLREISKYYPEAPNED